MDRVFLDANVLFSAAYREDAPLQRLWRVEGAQPLSSRCALAEAERNLLDSDQRQPLARLVRDVRIVPEPDETAAMPPGFRIPEKDRPIVLAALWARATHLLTGDTQHFGDLYGRRMGRTLVLRPAQYLAMRLAR